MIFAQMDPGSTRVPGSYFEINIAGGTSDADLGAVLIGQKLASGTHPAGRPILMDGSADTAADLFGDGSMLHRMYVQALAAGSLLPVTCIPFNDDAAAVPGVGSVYFSGSPTESGLARIYIDGVSVAVRANAGATPAAIAAALRDKILTTAGLPVTANSGGKLASITVDDQGSGYTVAPTVVFDPAGPTATAVLGTGPDADKVVSITVLTPGPITDGTYTISFAGGGGGVGAAATAVMDANGVIVTTLNAGEAAGDVRVRTRVYDDDRIPRGLTIEALDCVGGAGDPDAATMIDALEKANRTDYIAWPYASDSMIEPLEARLDQWFGPLRQRPAWAFSAISKNYADAVTYRDGRNNLHSVVVCVPDSVTAPYLHAVGMAMECGSSASIHPVRPFRGLYAGLPLGSPAESRFTFEQQNDLLQSLALYEYRPDGRPSILRVPPTYHLDQNGEYDSRIGDIQWSMTVAEIRRRINIALQRRFPRHIKVRDGVRVDPGIPVATPSLVRSTVVAALEDFARQFLIGFNAELFRLVRVEDISENKTAYAIYMPVELARPLHQFFGQIDAQ